MNDNIIYLIAGILRRLSDATNHVEMVDEMHDISLELMEGLERFNKGETKTVPLIDLLEGKFIGEEK